MTSSLVRSVPLCNARRQVALDVEVTGMPQCSGMFLEIAAGATSELTSPSDAAGSGAPLAGTVTLVMAEGRRVIRLRRELSPPVFGALIDEYQRVLRDVMLRTGGRQFKVSEDTAIAVFRDAKQAALAAVAVQNVVAAHEWPHKRDVAVSVGVHSAEVGSGWMSSAKIRCQALCDAAEGGQIFFSPSVAVLLEREDLGDLAIRDLGKQVTRRSGSPVRAFELVPAAPSDGFIAPE